MAKPVAAAVNTWDAELAKLAKLAETTEAAAGSGGTNWFGLRGGRLAYLGNDVVGNSINVVIVDQVLENHYYTERFNPDVLASPACFAYGEMQEDGSISEMAPHPASTAPQCESCAKCPHNQYGSSETGKGKACKNIRRIALLSEGDLDSVATAELAFMKIPVTSVKLLSDYTKQIATVLKRPTFAVVSTIAPVPDAKTQFKVTFAHASTITDGAQIGAIMERRAAAHAELMQPYTPSVEQPAAAAPARRKF